MRGKVQKKCSVTLGKSQISLLDTRSGSVSAPCPCHELVVVPIDLQTTLPDLHWPNYPATYFHGFEHISRVCVSVRSYPLGVFPRRISTLGARFPQRCQTWRKTCETYSSSPRHRTRTPGGVRAMYTSLENNRSPLIGQYHCTPRIRREGSRPFLIKRPLYLTTRNGILSLLLSGLFRKVAEHTCASPKTLSGQRPAALLPRRTCAFLPIS